MRGISGFRGTQVEKHCSSESKVFGAIQRGWGGDKVSSEGFALKTNFNAFGIKKSSLKEQDM